MTEAPQRTDDGRIEPSERRLPPWIRVRLSGGGVADAVHRLLDENALHTVCQGAQCPNKHECFGRGTATFMILGEVCTRDCLFCAVKAGAPQAVDPEEPRRVAEAAARLRLKHVVVTSVTRDDLEDGGASLFAATILAIRASLPAAAVEVLVPDFLGREKDIDTVLAARPDVFNHNIETVARLQAAIRPAARYERSLAVLKHAAAARPKPAIKSGLMAGLGETDDEILAAMRDLRGAGCELLTIGQYLAPSKRHLPVQRFVHPDVFVEFARRGLEMGFRNVASGPMVRSSYHAAAQFGESARRLPAAPGVGCRGKTDPISRETFRQFRVAKTRIRLYIPINSRRRIHA
jgi:lipoic acid synthetase